MVEDVSPNNWRIQAVTMTLTSVKILLINSYFPVDPKDNKAASDDLIETIQCIRTVLNTQEYDTVIWAGDINSDFKVISNKK